MESRLTAAELLKLVFSPRPTKNHIRKTYSLLRTVVTGQSQCARTRDLEDLISGPTILAFSEFRGDITTNKIISGGVVSSSSEQGPVVGYHIQSNELLGFTKYRTFLIT
jgi:hypothetical protein